MNGNPYTPGTPEYLAYQRALVAPGSGYNMSPRIAGPYTDPADVGLAHSVSRTPGQIGSPYPNPGGIDFGQDLPMVPLAPANAPAGTQFGYDAFGSPQIDPLSISPGGRNEVLGAPVTDYSGGFDTSKAAAVNTVAGPTRPGEYMTPDTLRGIEDIPLAEEADIPLGIGESEIGPAVTLPEVTVKPGEDPSTKSNRVGGRDTIAGAASGVGQMVGGVVNITQGFRALQNVDIEGAEAGVAAAYATRPGLGTPAEYYQMQKEAYDQRLMAMRLEDINRGLATNVAAAQQYGARGLGTTLASTVQAQRAQQQEVLQQQRLQTQALGTLAQARESEITRREQRATFDIGIAYDELKGEQARQQYAQQQLAQGVVGLAAGAARTAMTFGAEQGAKVTPGEFSHESNPIDIVQGGNKIGEMTGGEYIFNPTQANKMMSEASKGDSSLHKFVRKTLNKFHKDAAKHEGK